MGSLQCHYLCLSMDAFSRMQNDGLVNQPAVPPHPDKLAKCLSVVFIQAADCNKGQRRVFLIMGILPTGNKVVEVGPLQCCVSKKLTH